MNKKISQFELTNELQEQDLITLVQNGENKNITGGDFTTSLSDTFATNERVDGIEEDIDALETKVDNNYTDLSNKIVEGDQSVTNNLTSTITSYYDVLNNQLITLEDKHDKDMSEVNDTVQEWIDDIDNRSTLEQLQDALNRLTVAENTITALAELIANGGGGGEGGVGYHTQPTSTITSLQGYFKGTSANPLTTTDTLNQALSKLENQVEAVSSSSGSLPVIKMGENTTPTDRNIYTAGKVKEDYIFKTGDTVPGRIIYTTGIQGGTTFRSGWDGVGASLYPTSSKWNLELDNLFVRGNMTVNTLTINEIKAVGGDILVSLADMKCIKVEETSTGYKCYFDTEDGTKYNEFVVNDQAICQKFDGHDVKRYWRAVTEVGSDYIVLSKEICEPGSGTPAADDEIILLGHRVEGDQDYNEQMSDRRNAIFISANGENSPRIAFYSGIDDFSLEGKDRTVIGKNSKFVGAITVVSPDGSETAIPIYRGKWSADKTYYYYDYVSFDGSLWIATTENTNQVPSEESIYWELYVPKGENGQAGDDVAKWVEITGTRMFLYDGPDFTGTPTPDNLYLVAKVYGIDNAEYRWTDQNENIIEQSNSLLVTPNMFSTRTAIYRCTVEDQNTGYTYYDEVQVAKLCNGAEGLDAYYIDLTNYSASVPFDADGQILIDPTTVYTDVYAYHGINQIQIQNMTAKFTEGSGTCSVNGNRVTLQSLTSTSARITLTITVENGIEVTKDWYINQSKNGENGFNGEDAVGVYLSGGLVFHYPQYATVPNPTTIELTMQTNMDGDVTYKWYWTIAGTTDWQLLDRENGAVLIVHYDGVYFQTGADEITFRCVVSNGYQTYEDITTINNVRDGENSYRASLENQNMSVPSNYEGVVSDWSDAHTYTYLWFGGSKVKNADYTLTSTQITGVGTLTIDQERKLITVNSSSIPDEYLSVQWQINFTHNGEVRDTVMLTLSKNRGGKNGEVGNSSVQIYCNTNNASGPSRPTFTQMISASGGSSGGYSWYPDPTNSTTTLTWTSIGYYNPNTGNIDTLPDGSGYRWTKPVIFSPLNGENGADGVGIRSVVMQYCESTSQTSYPSSGWTTTVPTARDGVWIWTRLLITYTNGSTAYTTPVCTTGASGSDGEDGPGLSYRGEYDSTKTYGWTTNANGNVRDIVKHKDTYYAINKSQKGTVKQRPAPVEGSSGNVGPDGKNKIWVKFSSFENIATGLLFAEKATIAGLDFYNNIIQSQTGTFFIDGSWDPMNDGTPVMAFGNGAANAGTPSSTAALKIYGGGTLTVGDGTTTSNAGISGQGTSSTSVRFWAGSTHSNSSNAPFRVLQNGSMYASNATIKGNITATTANFTGKVTVGNLDGWKIPGILTISHYEAGTRRTLYSQGNYEIKSIQRQSVGVYKVYHNIPWSSDSSETAGFRNQFVLLWNGISRYGADNESFRGWIVAKEFSYQMFYIYCYDSEGTMHDIGGTKTAVDLIILGYGNE